tara:strand:- start:43 stop:723 length:681 start_codon:yes stop_codon:yes gene_type:complete
MSYTLIIPIFNEKKSIPILLKQLKQLEKTVFTILINDGSTDGTKDLLLELNNPQLSVIHNRKNIGKGGSIIKAIEMVKTKYVIFMDGDLEVDTKDIPKLINMNKKTEKVVVGNRWSDININYFSINYLGNLIINKFFNALYGTSFKDILCCFKVLDINFLKSLKLCSLNFSIETEIMSKLALKKTETHEININYSRRTIEDGKKIKYTDVFHILYTMVQIRFKGNL